MPLVYTFLTIKVTLLLSGNFPLILLTSVGLLRYGMLYYVRIFIRIGNEICK
jgi:hypothetical protein